MWLDFGYQPVAIAKAPPPLLGRGAFVFNHFPSSLSAVSAVKNSLAFFLRLQEDDLQVLVQVAQAGGHFFQHLEGDFMVGF